MDTKTKARTKNVGRLNEGDRIVAPYYGPCTVVRLVSGRGVRDVRVRPDDTSKLAESNTTGTVTLCNAPVTSRYELAD
jgi:hypothetical protein